MAEGLTRRELVANLRWRDKLKLRQLRDAIREAKLSKRGRLRAVSAECKAARAHVTASAKARREALRETVRRERIEGRGSCSASAEKVRDDVARKVGAARTETARLRGNTKAEIAGLRGGPRSGAGGRAAAVARSESDSEVKHEVERRFWPVWEKVKHHIRGKAHASRAEVFAQWMHDNSARVAEILHAKEEKDLHDLIAAERRLARDVARGERYRGHVATIATHHADADEWGG